MTRLSEIEKTDGLKKHELLQAWGTDRGSKGTYPSLHWVRHIEQLEGRAQTLEGALLNLMAHINRVVYRDTSQLRLGPGIPAYDDAQAALAATGEEGKKS